MDWLQGEVKGAPSLYTFKNQFIWLFLLNTILCFSHNDCWLERESNTSFKSWTFITQHLIARWVYMQTFQFDEALYLSILIGQTQQTLESPKADHVSNLHEGAKLRGPGWLLQKQGSHIGANFYYKYSTVIDFFLKLNVCINDYHGSSFVIIQSCWWVTHWRTGDLCMGSQYLRELLWCGCMTCM